MFKLNRRHHVLALIVLVLVIFSASSVALVMSRDEGAWPGDWPKELEKYRKQARTIEIATGIQENVYEIPFDTGPDFEKIWPVILKLKDAGAPLKLRSIETSFDEKKSLFDNRKPSVRIYSYVHPAWPSKYPGGKELVAAPPWPQSAMLANGQLSEYVTPSWDHTTWIPIIKKSPVGGFRYRARTDIELVVDGSVIDLNRIRLPGNTPIIDLREFEKAGDTNPGQKER